MLLCLSLLQVLRLFMSSLRVLRSWKIFGASLIQRLAQITILQRRQVFVLNGKARILVSFPRLKSSIVRFWAVQMGLMRLVQIGFIYRISL